MRVLLPVLLSAIAVLAEDPQVTTPAAQLSDNLSIPARLSKTIDTNKCKAGDAVEMRTLESVLIGNGLVMPENTKLHGTIVNAASRHSDQPSWVLLVVERAQWKEHMVPLHAFVTSQITIKAQVSAQNNNAFDNAVTLPSRRRSPRDPFQNAPGPGVATARTRPLGDATVEPSDTQQLSYHGVEDLRMLQDKTGRVFLVSQKAHLKLPSGTMLMLRNRPIAAAPVAAKTSGSPQ